MASSTAGVVSGAEGWPVVTVKDTDTVVFKGQPGGTHSFSVRNSKLEVLVGETTVGAKFEETWNTPAPGEYEYYCRPHDGSMNGKIVVEATSAGRRLERRGVNTTTTTSEPSAESVESSYWVPDAPFASSHGLTTTTHTGWDKLNRAVTGAAMTTTTHHDDLHGDFNVPMKRYGVNSQRLGGLFVAPHSAYYSFYAEGRKFSQTVSGRSPGTSIEILEAVSDLEDCKLVCLTYSTCMSIVYRQSAGTCAILGRDYSTDYQTTTDDAVVTRRNSDGMCSLSVGKDHTEDSLQQLSACDRSRYEAPHKVYLTRGERYAFRHEQATRSSGWVSEYYQNWPSCCSDTPSLAEIGRVTPSFTKINQQLWFSHNDFAAIEMHDHFVTHHYTYFTPTATELHTFRTGSDDGSYLFVDGVAVVRNGGNHATHYREGSIALVKGKAYRIDVTMHESGGGQTLYVDMKTVSIYLILSYATSPPTVVFANSVTVHLVKVAAVKLVFFSIFFFLFFSAGLQPNPGPVHRRYHIRLGLPRCCPDSRPAGEHAVDQDPPGRAVPLVG